VEKGTTVAANSEPDDDDDDVADAGSPEGKKKLRTHLRSERSSRLRRAKKAAFRRLHGRLFCERCKMDPIQQYKTIDAESCIEVHHSKVAVANMLPGHRTRLEDLECLCANCHRLTHREMRLANAGN
jgi:5-methylcytosine-specific restriction protein A